MRETQLAAVVVRHLRDEGWTVYQEVSAGGPVADIVAVSKPLIHVVECKTTLSLDLMAQARDWLRYAHLVSVAVPRPRRRSRGSWFAEGMLKRLGIGLIWVDDLNGLTMRHDPELRRKVHPTRLPDALHPDQITGAPAGSARGGHSTPFKRTVSRLVDVVRREPGITMAAALAKSDHHYASPASGRAQISKLIRLGVIEGIELRYVGRRLTLHPKG